ncbi:MAG: hypothetical protein H0U44_07340 [Flavisolibacter sp.]|jgi:hypothetical protein|nr:hypothetical protein [Flavisolibacter sp.]
MRRNSTSSLGAFHPILFFLFVYGLSLFLALFVCRTVYYSLNDNNSVIPELEQSAQLSGPGAGATAFR